MFKTYLENCIVLRENSCKCYLCHCEISKHDRDLLENHMKLDSHKEKVHQIDKTVKQQESEKFSTISESQRRKIVENCITCLFTIPDLFYCHICEESTTGLVNTLEHIRSTPHCEKIKLSTKNETQKIANKTAPTKSVLKGIDVQNSIQNAQTTHLENHIEPGAMPNVLKCSICQCEIWGPENIKSHILGNQHQRMLKAQNTIVSNVINDSYFIEAGYCLPCKVFLNDSTKMQCHLMLHLHMEYDLTPEIDIIRFSITRKKNLIIKCLLCDANALNDKTLQTHLNSDVHLERLKYFASIRDNLKLDFDITMQLKENVPGKKKYEPKRSLLNASYCTLCNVSMLKKDQNAHANSKRHNTNISKEISKVCINHTRIKIDDFNYYECFICQQSFPSVTSLLEHYKTNEHQKKIKCFQMLYLCPYTILMTVKDKLAVNCSLCENNIYLISSAIEHLLGNKHRKNVQSRSANKDDYSSIDKENLKFINNNVNEQASAVTDLKMKNIVSSERNHTNSKVLPPTALKKKNELKIGTKEMTKSSSSSQDLKVVIAPKLPKKSAHGIGKFESNSEELMKLGFSRQNIDSLDVSKSDSVDDLLNNLMKLDLSKSQKRQILPSAAKRKPRIPSNTEESRNSSFEKNVMKFGKDYIRLCIDPGPDNIYNVIPELLRLIELGVMLAIPLDSQTVCLACGLQLPDNQQVLFEHLQNLEHVLNVYKMETDDKEFEKFPDQFSDLKLAKSYMQEYSENVVQCFVCNIEVGNENALIRSHISSANHTAKSKIWTELANEIISIYSYTLNDFWYYAQVFVCKVCEKKFDFEIDFIIHLQDSYHIKNVNKLKIKDSTSFYFGGCSVCVTYWFGKPELYALHCDDPFHKRFAKNKDLMVPDMTTVAIEFLDKVEEKSNYLITESNKASQERAKETILLTEIKNTVKPLYPKAKAYIFGSRLSDLGFLDSDVDVFLDCDNVYYENTTQEKCQYYLSSVKKFFEDQPDIWILDEILLVSRVPIIKLRHIPTGLKCDISFINGLSVEKSKLIGLYISAFSICRKMILYLKKWLSLCQIFGSDGITTFAISWCVIFYLQIEGILPSVHDSIENRNGTKLVAGWQCGHGGIIQAEKSVKNFEEHIKGFFTYYADFDYRKNVICPYLGEVIEKRKFAFTNQLPVEMKIYKDRIMNNNCSIFRFDSPMCIQDPVDLSQNMTKAVKKQQLRCFIQYCRESSEI